MATYFRMPGVSADSDEAVLDSWAVEPGASISIGQCLVVVETEKAMVDVAAESEGTVHTLLVEAGVTVPVGDPIAVLLAPGEAEAEAEKLLAALGRGPSGGSEVPAAVVTAPEPRQVAPSGAGEPAGRRFSSPSARRRARELGVAIDDVVGTGPRGRIVQADVESAVAVAETGPVPTRTVAAPTEPPAPAAPGAGRPGWTEIPHTRLRRLVAERMQASASTAPHFYLRASIRVDALLALRETVNAGRKERISLNDFVVRAAGQALADVPEMNVIWTDDAVLRASTADVAVAIASDRGLVTPVVTDVASRSLSAISATIRDFADRAKHGRLQQSELEGGTLTVSNLGMAGVEEFSAILNPPQAGILAVGAATRKPVVGERDTVEIGTVMSVVLSVDHRPVDGVLAARWLGRLTELLEDPIALLV